MPPASITAWKQYFNYGLPRTPYRGSSDRGIAPVLTGQDRGRSRATPTVFMRKINPTLHRGCMPYRTGAMQDSRFQLQGFPFLGEWVNKPLMHLAACLQRPDNRKDSPFGGCV